MASEDNIDENSSPYGAKIGFNTTAVNHRYIMSEETAIEFRIQPTEVPKQMRKENPERDHIQKNV